MTDLIREPMSVWMVWSKHGHRPTFTHANKKRAMREAERLARLHPGQKFLVMRVDSKVSVTTPSTPTEGTEQ